MKSIAVTLFFVLAEFTAAGQADSTHYQKGVVSARAERYEEAIHHFSKSIEQDPGDPYAWFNRGLSNFFLDSLDAAVGDFDKAITLDPSYKRAYLNRGIAKRKLTDYEGALADFKLAIIKAPDYKEAYYHRGYVYEMLGNKDSACRFYKIASDFGMKDIDDKIEICNDPSKTFDKHITKLTKFAPNGNYGFTQENPIKVGGGPSNQHQYLNLLRDVKGNKISYTRTGSCCAYKLENSPMGMALLDRYKITYRDENNEEQSVVVFISFYEYEEPMIIKGFKTIEKH